MHKGTPPEILARAMNWLWPALAEGAEYEGVTSKKICSCTDPCVMWITVIHLRGDKGVDYCHKMLPERNQFYFEQLLVLENFDNH